MPRSAQLADAALKARMDRLRPFVPQVLGEVYTLLRDRSRWTRGAVARNQYGSSTRAENPDAVQWCSLGAITVSTARVLQNRQGYDERDRLLLADLVGNEFLPVLRTVAKELRPEYGRDLSLDHIPAINDSARKGGYPAVIEALRRVTGSPALAVGVSRRTAAALKGWATRRSRLAQRAVPVAQEPSMVFGGTLPTTDARTPRTDTVTVTAI